MNNNPDNPIINIRSFGENPKSVGEFVAQEVRGIEENGGLATAKHFPGHGDVSVDSHLALPTVPGDRKELEATELVPFRAAIGASVGSVMPGHLAVPAFEPDASVPATTSRNILTGLLRDELKYKGLVVTDAMDMGGVTSRYPPGEAAVRAVEAGADVLLMPPVPDAAMAGLERAVRSGRITEKRVDESVRRILQAKSRLGLDRNRLADIEHLDEKFARPEFEAQAQSIADRGVTLLRDTAHLLPLDATKPLRVLLVSLSADADPYPGETIEPEIRWRVDSLKALRADMQFANVSTLKLPPADTYDVAIAALFVRVADRKGNVGFPDEQRAFVNQIDRGGKAGRRDCVRQPLFDRGISGREDMARGIFDEFGVAGGGGAGALWASSDPGTDSGHRPGDGEARRWLARGREFDDLATRIFRNGRATASGVRIA